VPVEFWDGYCTDARAALSVERMRYDAQEAQARSADRSRTISLRGQLWFHSDECSSSYQRLRAKSATAETVVRQIIISEAFLFQTFEDDTGATAVLVDELDACGFPI